ncbi:MAG: hypothetical protein WD226_08170 [Planctomycetota bacterium]
MPSFRPSLFPALTLAPLLALAGCFNSNHESIDLGSVSVGQQLIDLQRALEAGAIDVEEYARLKDAIVELADETAD